MFLPKLFTQPAAYTITGRSYRTLSETIHDVLVVGAGPTGLTIGALLSHMGIRATVIEKKQQLTSHPQAHFINHRSMEIFRPLNGLAAEIQAACPPLRDWRKFLYCESLTGRVLGEVDHFHGQHSPLRPEISPEPVMHLSQNRLLPMLLRRCIDQQVLFGVEATAIEHVDGAAEVTCISKTPSEKEMVLRCKYLVVADGANSTLRQQIGIKMTPGNPIQHLINVYFESVDLAKILSRNPAMLYFVLSSDAIMVLVAHDLRRGSFVAQIPYFPPLQTPEEFDSAQCEVLLARAIGSASVVHDLNIESINPWVMQACVADKFSIDTSIFLAGDAAHVFPPAGGFGMNTGIQDTHNLAWKLASVLKSNSHPDILRTYGEERKLIAQANAELSIRNWNEASQVPAVLGLDPQHANLLSKVSAEIVGSLFPKEIAKSFLNLGLNVGKALSGVRGPIGPFRRRKLSKLLQSGSTLQLQYPSEDIGFQYMYKTPLEPRSGSHMSPSRSKSRMKTSTGSVDVGRRVPHCYFQLSSDDRYFSTLDFFGSSKAMPVLISPHGSKWALAALEVNKDMYPMMLVFVTSSSQALKTPSHRTKYIPFLNVIDAPAPSDMNLARRIDVIDSSGSWTRLTNGQTILVRPDGHIWWISPCHCDPHPTHIQQQLILMLHQVGST